MQEYNSFKSSGLVISARTTELAGWGKVDMALPTKKVQKTKYPAEFPEKASGTAFGKTKKTIVEVEDKLKEVRARYKGEKPDQSSRGKVRDGGKLLMDFGYGPEEIGDKKPYFGAESIPYGEAQIHYKPSDILGVYVERENKDAIGEALKLKDHLDKLLGKNLPLVEYHLGNLTIHESLSEFLALCSNDTKETDSTN